MRGHTPFDEDVEKNGRYIYTGSEAPKSSIVANALQTRMLHSAIKNLGFKSILDVGCGDGTYTAEFLTFEKSRIMGVDPAVKAIEFASKKWGHQSRLSFTHLSLESLIKNNAFFDLIVFRGVLHHCEDPLQVLSEASQLSDTIVILEPNGLNPIMKLIEKVSPYHRAHSEKSFSRKRISGWLRNCGFEVEAYSLGVLVPFFFPAFLITPMLKFEPVLHKIPILGKFLFGTQVLLSKKVS
jgi:2-polyprenyl-3-methyl-5-hydroxy-6-metoxy-1,4-benzoquinol methylase